MPNAKKPEAKKPKRLFSPAFYEKRIGVAKDKRAEVSKKRQSLSQSLKRVKNIVELLQRRKNLAKNPHNKKKLDAFDKKNDSYLGSPRPSLKKSITLHNRLIRRRNSYLRAIKNLDSRIKGLEANLKLAEKRRAARS